MTDNRDVMARNICHYMEVKGVNATEVCKALDFKQNTFSDWCNGKTYPRIDAIEKMANYFGISKAFLVEDIQQIDFMTDKERALILDYRKADRTTQESINRLLEYSKLYQSDVPSHMAGKAARRMSIEPDKILTRRKEKK